MRESSYNASCIWVTGKVRANNLSMQASSGANESIHADNLTYYSLKIFFCQQINEKYWCFLTVLNLGVKKLFNYANILYLKMVGYNT